MLKAGRRRSTDEYMYLSALQKYVLTTCWGKKGRVSKKAFEGFYARRKPRPAKAHIPGIITKSLERLTERGLINAHGTKTQEKWIIQSVSLTARGRRAARALFGVQTTMQFKG